MTPLHSLLSQCVGDLVLPLASRCLCLVFRYSSLACQFADLLPALWVRAIPTLAHSINLKAFPGIFLCCCRTFAQECIDPGMFCFAGVALETHAITVLVFIDQSSQVVGSFFIPFLAVWARAPMRILDVFVCFEVACKLSPYFKIPLSNRCLFS